MPGSPLPLSLRCTLYLYAAGIISLLLTCVLSTAYSKNTNHNQGVEWPTVSHFDRDERISMAVFLCDCNCVYMPFCLNF